MEKSHLGLLIGRFQPLHFGHCRLIEAALQTCETLLIVIGSSNRARSFKNPWTFAERKALIAQQFPNARIDFAAIPDFFYAETAWTDAVKQSVAAFQPTQVTLFGHSKDESTYYLSEFPEWEYVELPNFQGMNATKIREDYFYDAKIEIDLPRPTAHFLGHFQLTPAYTRLAEEARFVRDYQNSWQHSPYPPIFVTTDSLVICDEKVLLIKRKFCPGQGLYALPGGFLEKNEWIKTGLCRELIEETRIGLDVHTLLQSLQKIRVFDYYDRSQIGRVITHVGHFELPSPLPHTEAADDALNVEWIPLTQLSTLQDAFHDDHYQIITTLLDRTRL